VSDADDDFRGGRVFNGHGGVFNAALVLFAGTLALACAFAASKAYFAEDDFRWLATVRAPDFSLLGAWLPFSERDWWSYRPLGMHTYWLVGAKVFGLVPAGFYAVSLLVHFAGGGLVYRLACQLGFPARVAALTALLAVSRPPSMDVVFWASAFSYFAVATASLATAVLLGEYVARGQERWRAASCVCFGAALFSQESALGLPAVLFGLALFLDRQRRDGNEQASSASWGRALAGVAPHVALAVLYAIHVFVLIAPFERTGNYRAVLGANLLRNAAAYAEWVAGGPWMSTGVLGISALALLWLWRDPAGRRVLASWLAPLACVLAGWIVVALAPFVVVRMTAARFAIALEIPLCLAFGAVMAALWRARPERSAIGWREAALVAMLLVAFPRGTLREAVEAPRGVAAHAMVEQFTTLEPDPAHGARYLVLYGGQGLLGNGWRVHRDTWTGTPMLATLHPDRGLALSYRGIGREGPAADFTPGPLLLEIAPDLTLSRASTETRRAFCLAGLESSSPGASAMAAECLAHVLGEAARAPIVEAAKAHHGGVRSSPARALLLLEGESARADARRLIPDARLRGELEAIVRARWAEGAS
jgi:hypothetical protein